MNDMPLKLNRRRWPSKRRLLWSVGRVAAGGLCIFLTLLYLACRQARIEQEVVADLLSKSAGGRASVDSLPTWRNRLYDLLGIPRPVRYLNLRGKQITDDDLARLKSLHRLELLSLDECSITDNGVREIAKVPTLRSLSLVACHGITDTSFIYIGRMRSLQYLDICWFLPKITGRNIEHLSALPNLATLHLVDCPAMSDDAVEALASLKQLDTLDIRGTAISEDGRRRLEIALPNTIVLSSDF